jgi:acetyl esterase/lipase
MEVGHPTNGQPAAGAVILIHGGGWQQSGRSLLVPNTVIAMHFNALGWDTYNIDYRPEAASLPDVVATYDLVRSKLGKGKPICAVGSSAGGNLALLLAAARPQVACVMSYAGPTDLTVLNHPNLTIYPFVHALSGAVGGNLAAWSPLKQVNRIHARALLAYATNDPLVPVSQATMLASKLPGSQLVLLAPGHQTFIHSYVLSSDLTRTYAIQDSLLASVAARK